MSWLELVQDEDVQAYIPLYERLEIAPLYNKTINRAYSDAVINGVPNELIKSVVISALQDVLAAYSKTEHTTKAGGILRKIASFLSLLNPLKWKRHKANS